MLGYISIQVAGCPAYILVEPVYDAISNPPSGHLLLLEYPILIPSSLTPKRRSSPKWPLFSLMPSTAGPISNIASDGSLTNQYLPHAKLHRVTVDNQFACANASWCS